MVEFVRWKKEEVHCKNCGAVLSYALEDVIVENTDIGTNEFKHKRYIICPKCHKEVGIGCLRCTELNQ